MKNFIELDELEDNKSSIKPIVIKRKDVELVQQVKELKEIDCIKKEEIITEDCNVCEDASKFYGERKENGNFKVDNLFSELVNEYERAIARQNLGIADSETLNWGNIKGNIRKQSDLHDYIFISPKFKGCPTSSTPSLTDSSESIATTEWVMNYVGQNNLPPSMNSFTVNPFKAMVGDKDVNVTIKWEYLEEIESQKFNGVEINKGFREYNIILNETTSLELEYTLTNGKSYNKIYLFLFEYPNYYGTNEDYSNLDKTLSKSFKLLLKDDEYVYIMLPDKEAQLSVNGIVGGFEMVKEQKIHGIIYYTYKSINHSLGKLIVNLMDYD